MGGRDDLATFLCGLRGDEGNVGEGGKGTVTGGSLPRTEIGAVPTDEMGREVILEGARCDTGDTGVTGSGILRTDEGLCDRELPRYASCPREGYWGM